MSYYVDGVHVATHQGNRADMRVVASTASTDSLLRVDSMLLTPYASPGTFTSRVFDSLSLAPEGVPWGVATWDATTPAGTASSSASGPATRRRLMPAGRRSRRSVSGGDVEEVRATSSTRL